MESNVAKKENSVYNVNLFYTITIIWSIVVQMLPIHPNLYQYLSFLLPIFIYIVINRKNTKRILRFKKVDLKTIFITFLIWLFMLPISILIVSLYNDYFGDHLSKAVTKETAETILEALVFTAITPAFIEEMFMRGIILDGYRNKSKFVAAFMNGFMFGMLHLNTFQFSHTLFFGMITTYIVFATNSIFPSIFIHFMNNSLPIFLELFFPQTKKPTQGNENINYLSLIILALISLLIIIVLIRILARVNNINLHKREKISREKIFNKPLIISTVIFIIFNLLLTLIMKKT